MKDKIISQRSKGQKIARGFIGITGTLCVAYCAVSFIKSEAVPASVSEDDSVKLVILGQEDEEAIAIAAQEISQPDGSVMSFDDFIKGKICGSCSRRCLLTSPHCNNGRKKVEKQQNYYTEALVLLAEQL